MIKAFQEQGKIQVKIQFQIFFEKKFKFLGFHVVIATCEDLSIDVMYP